MTFDVEVGQGIRTVTVHRKGLLLHVDIGGRMHVVDVRRVGDATLSMLVSNGEAARPVTSVDASIHPSAAAALGARMAVNGNPGAFEVHVDGRTIPVQIKQAGAFGRQKREGAGAAGTGPQRIVSPMPGKVVRVLVKAGDEVRARQGLVVVEAMKMENELRAARNGRVRDVAVTEGQSVEAGTVLLVVE
jgi:biotin carboxyl carrier protein